jgi:hypothetical protein
MDYSDIYLSKQINDLQSEIRGLRSVQEHLFERLARVEESLPKPMTAREAYDDALSAIAGVLAEPLTQVILGKPGSQTAIIDDIVGEIKRRRDRNAGGK